MPSFVSHVVYAQKFIKQNKIDDPTGLFVIGNLIPDIRYLGVIDRSVTHIPFEDQSRALELVNNLIETKGDLLVKNINLFKKGFIFHNYLDTWWSSKFPISNQDRFLGSALKLYEDQLLYPNIEHLDQILTQMKKQTKIFRLKGVSNAEYEKWVEINISYLSIQPTTSSQLAHFRHWGFFNDDQNNLLEKALTEIPEGTKEQMESVFDSFSLI